MLIGRVEPSSPAEAAGLKPYDLLLSYDDQKLFSPEQLSRLVATDRAGGRWVVELGGPFVRHRGGLTSADAVWRTLGRAHVLRGLGERVLVLTSELPRRRSEFDLAIRAAGPAAVFDVIDVFDEHALERLAAYADGADRPVPGFWNPADLD